MIRFQPDSLLQAFTRFFDMAAPDANVYVEIAAPDIRFAAIMLFAVGAAAAWHRLGQGRRPTFALLLLLLATTPIWLWTSGNGRYFMPMLVAAGPLAIALVCLLPVTRLFKATLALGLVAGQAFVLWQQPPWNNWTLTHWSQPPYFGVRLGPEETQAAPTTYASLSTLSYSLIAPQFPPQSRWINLPASSGTPRDEQWTHEFLQRAMAQGPVKMIAPSLPSASLPDGLPSSEVLDAFNKLLAQRNLHISGTCRHIVSPGLVRMAEREKRMAADMAGSEGRLALGFWTCPLVYDAQLAKAARQGHEAPPEKVLRVYAKMGALCPRFFPAGESANLRLPDGWQRHYATSETRVYVLDNGQIWYRFWRSLNPVFVGNADELLADKVQVDCSAVRGSDGAWRTGSQ